MTEKTRNYGIDLLRMVAMYMVVLLHVLGHGAGGGISGKTITAGYETAWFLEIAAYCAVNCYAIISGYVGVDAKYRYTSFALLWLRTVFYTVLFTGIFAFVLPGSVGIQAAINAFFPVMSNSYWYFTCYALLFLCMPLLNLIVHRLHRKQLRVILLSLLVLYSLLQTLFVQTPFGHGYDTLWLGILYLVGAYIKKYSLFENLSKSRAILGYLAMILAVFLSKLILQLILPLILHREVNGNLLITYYSPLIFGAAVFLFLFFRQLRLPGWAEGVVKRLSPLAFSVYLIHSQPLVWKHLMSGRFAPFASLPAPLLALAVLGTSLGIYLFCILIDFFREAIFKALKLKERIGKIEKKWIGSLFDEL